MARSTGRKFADLEARKGRLEPDERNLRDIDDMELYLAEHLRDWQLAVGAHAYEQLIKVMETMEESVRIERAVVKNDLGREQYLEGQLNIIETVIQQVSRAALARRQGVGQVVKWEPPTR